MKYIDLLEQVTRHEGWRNTVYKCPAGKLTIGVGHNLEDRPISDTVVRMILRDDLTQIQDRLRNHRYTTRELGYVRFYTLVNMAFNIGFGGFLAFTKMRAAIGAKDYMEAAKEMYHSKWATQVGQRAEELIYQMAFDKCIDEKGEWREQLHPLLEEWRTP